MKLLLSNGSEVESGTEELADAVEALHGQGNPAKLVKSAPARSKPIVREPVSQENLEKAKAQPSDTASVTPEKARQILHDGEVHGKPLTDQQRKFFGAIGGHLPAPGKTKKSQAPASQEEEERQEAKREAKKDPTPPPLPATSKSLDALDGFAQSEDLAKADDGKPGESLGETSTDELKATHKDILARLKQDPKDAAALQARRDAIAAELKKRAGMTDLKTEKGCGMKKSEFDYTRGTGTIQSIPGVVDSDPHPGTVPEAARQTREFWKANERTGIDELAEFAKGGPYIGPRGGKWADAQHTVPWSEEHHGKKAKKPAEEAPGKVAGLTKDVKDLHQAIKNLRAIEGGGKVENLSEAGARNNIEGLIGAIKNKINSHKRKLLDSGENQTAMQLQELRDKLEIEAHDALHPIGGEKDTGTQGVSEKEHREAGRYSDPSAAHEAALKLESQGWKNVKIKKEGGKHVLSGTAPNKTKKSEVSEMSGIELLGAYADTDGDLEKAQTMPEGNPKQKLGQGTEQGGKLAGVGETKGSSDSAPGPGQNKDGQVTGSSTAKDKLSDDDEEDESQMKPHKKPIETAKSVNPGRQREMVGHETAQAVSQIRKGEDDVPITGTGLSEQGEEVELEKGRVGQQGMVRYSEQSDIEAEALLKSDEFYSGGSPRVIPFSRPIGTGQVCLKCETLLSKSLTACPNCGNGTVTHQVVPGGEAQGDHDGTPIVKSQAGKLRPRRVEDVKIGK